MIIISQNTTYSEHRFALAALDILLYLILSRLLGEYLPTQFHTELPMLYEIL